MFTMKGTTRYIPIYCSVHKHKSKWSILSNLSWTSSVVLILEILVLIQSQKSSNVELGLYQSFARQTLVQILPEYCHQPLKSDLFSRTSLLACWLEVDTELFSIGPVVQTKVHVYIGIITQVEY